MLRTLALLAAMALTVAGAAPSSALEDAGDEAAPKLDWKPVTMTKWEPEERKY